jgi:hypothetical protein
MASVPTRLADTLNQPDDRAPERRVVDPHKGFEQSQAVGAGKKVVDVCGGGFREAPAVTGWSRSLLEEERNRDVQDMADVLQAACTDAIGPFFVFLHLLEREAQLIGQLFLTHAKYQTAHANAATDMLISWMGAFG